MAVEHPRVFLAIGSQFENIELVQIVVEESLRKFDLTDKTAHSIGLAVREAVANAIKHGNREDPAKKVEVEFGVEAGEVFIAVSDHGEGFDPEQVKDPLDPENLLRPSGRGLFFMNNFMDEIQYSFKDEGGTVVTLRKRLDSTPPEEPQKEEDR